MNYTDYANYRREMIAQKTAPQPISLQTTDVTTQEDVDELVDEVNDEINDAIDDAKKGMGALGWILIIVGVLAAAFAVWFFMCRNKDNQKDGYKPADEEKGKK